MAIEIKVDCNECGRTIQLDDVTYCFECWEKAKAGQAAKQDLFEDLKAQGFFAFMTESELETLKKKHNLT